MARLQNVRVCVNFMQQLLENSRHMHFRPNTSVGSIPRALAQFLVLLVLLALLHLLSFSLNTLWSKSTLSQREHLRDHLMAESFGTVVRVSLLLRRRFPSLEALQP